MDRGVVAEVAGREIERVDVAPGVVVGGEEQDPALRIEGERGDEVERRPLDLAERAEQGVNVDDATLKAAASLLDRESDKRDA